jgi:predicted RNase H-like HicB family nuclease
MHERFTAIIVREAGVHVTHCPELGIASQGDPFEAARESLREALELFFETASPGEIAARLHADVHATSVEVTVR